MRKIKYYIICSIACVFSGQALALGPSIHSKLRKSMVEVLTPSCGFSRESQSVFHDFSGQRGASKGTAFCVDASLGLFVTNKHVAGLNTLAPPILLNFTQKRLPARVVYEDPLYDLAILQADRHAFVPFEFEALGIGVLHTQDFELPVQARTTRYWMSSTRTQAQSRMDTPQTIAQSTQEPGYAPHHCLYTRPIAAPVSCRFQKRWEVYFGQAQSLRGDSGSPILDEKGRVVALSWGAHQDQTLACPADYIKEVLDSLRNRMLPKRFVYQALGRMSPKNANHPHFFFTDALPGLICNPEQTQALKPSRYWAQSVSAWKQTGPTWERLFHARPATDLEALRDNLRESELLVQLKPAAMQDLSKRHGPAYVRRIEACAHTNNEDLLFTRLVRINGRNLEGLPHGQALQVVHSTLWEATLKGQGSALPLKLELKAFDGSQNCIPFTYTLDALRPNTQPGAQRNDLLFHVSNPAGVPRFITQPGKPPCTRTELLTLRGRTPGPH